jgi:hypothetical protein
VSPRLPAAFLFPVLTLLLRVASIGDAESRLGPKILLARAHFAGMVQIYETSNIVCEVSDWNRLNGIHIWRHCESRNGNRRQRDVNAIKECRC